MYSHDIIKIIDRETNLSLFDLKIDDYIREKLPEHIIKYIDVIDNGECLDFLPTDINIIELTDACANITSSIKIKILRIGSTLSYRVHDGREFDMMAKGLKPMAVFSDVHKSSKLYIFLQKYFDKEVLKGNFIKYTIDKHDSSEPDIVKNIIYTLKNEKWRIESYKTMIDAAKISRWNDGLEFIEGSLLGYSKEESDEWLAFRRKNGLKWGFFSFFCVIKFKELKGLERNGMKAFDSVSNRSIFLYSPNKNESNEINAKALVVPDSCLLVRIYIRFLNINKFYVKQEIINGVEFGVFCIPHDDIVYLNEVIDGSIEIIK